MAILILCLLLVSSNSAYAAPYNQDCTVKVIFTPGSAVPITKVICCFRHPKKKRRVCAEVERQNQSYPLYEESQELDPLYQEWSY